MEARRNFLKECRILVRTLDKLNRSGESISTRVRAAVCCCAAASKPGTMSLTRVGAKMTPRMANIPMTKAVMVKMVPAISRASFFPPRPIYCTKTGMKATESVPKIRRLKSRSGTRKAAM